MNYVETIIERHETLWTKGVLKKTRHKKSDIYTISYPKCGEEYIAKDSKGWIKLCGAPINIKYGMRYSTHGQYYKSFEDLRQSMIDKFPEFRQQKLRMKVVQFPYGIMVTND